MTQTSSAFNFHYIKGKPSIMAKLKYKNNPSHYLEFLVDSGSSYTLIPASKATLLGINQKDLKDNVIIELANRDEMEVFKTNLDLIIRDKKLRIPVLVAQTEVECLLGRAGVFRFFDILFQERREQIEMRNNG